MPEWIIASIFILSWFSLVIGGIIAITRNTMVRTAEKLSAKWKVAAARLGLVYRQYDGGINVVKRRVIEGTLRGFPIEIECSRNIGFCTRIVVRGQGRIPRSFELRTERFQSGVTKAFEEQDILTHDHLFDQRVRVRGNEVEAVAAFGPRARVLVMKHVVDVLDGEVHQDPRVLGIEWLVGEAQALVELAESLAIDRPIRVRLAENATTDRDSRVQLRNLALLQEHYGGSEAALVASRALVGAQDRTVRLRAAKHLGDEGLPTVEAMAVGEDVATPVRIEALRHLGAKLPRVRLLPMLERTLAFPDTDLRRTAIETFGALRHRPAVRTLVELGDRAQQKQELVDAADEELVALARALGQIGDAAAEPALLRWLERDSVPVRIAIAGALREVGTIAAVEPLIPLTKGALADSDLKRAARDAIDSIQGRLGDVEEGRLSLTDSSGRDGALSIATEGGALSFSHDAAPPPPPRPRSSQTASVMESANPGSVPASRSKTQESE